MRSCLDQYASFSASGGVLYYPAVLLAFLESDIVHRSTYWDIIPFTGLDEAGSTQSWKVVQIDEESKARFNAQADEFRHIIANSLQSKSNSTSFALNTLQAIIADVSMSKVAASPDIDIDVSMTNDEDQQQPAEQSTRAIPIQLSTPSPTPAPAVLKKLSSATRIINPFADKSATTTSSSSTLPLQKLLELPGLLLDELISLLNYLDSNSLFQVHDFYRQSIRQGNVLSNLSADFLPSAYTLLLNSQGKAKMVDGVLRHNWLSQYRLQAVLLSTTAFRSISRRIELLQQIQMKDLASISENIRFSFVLNLYNLLSLHASLLIPWPSTSNHQARLLWQSQHARYKIGSQYLSLLHIEYGLLRGQQVALDLSTIKDLNDSSSIDMKALQNLALSSVDPRAQFALCKPYRSSPRLISSYTYKNLKRLLYDTISSYFLQINLSSQEHLRLPKFMRYQVDDYLNYIPPVPSARAKSQPIAATEAEEEKVVEPVASVSTSPVNDWDLAQVTTKDRSAASKVIINQHQSNISSFPLQSDHLRLESLFDDAYNGDVRITEAELQRILRILQLGLDVRDRRHMLRSYRSCFLGR
jgi:hypothetical protein